MRVLLLPPLVAVSSGIGAGAGLSSCEGLREKDGNKLRRFDVLEVVPVSEGGGMMLLPAFPSPICCSLLMCSDGTSNIEVGRDRSPARPGRRDCVGGAAMSRCCIGQTHDLVVFAVVKMEREKGEKEDPCM